MDTDGQLDRHNNSRRNSIRHNNSRTASGTFQHALESISRRIKLVQIVWKVEIQGTAKSHCSAFQRSVHSGDKSQINDRKTRGWNEDKQPILRKTTTRQPDTDRLIIIDRKTSKHIDSIQFNSYRSFLYSPPLSKVHYGRALNSFRKSKNKLTVWM